MANKKGISHSKLKNNPRYLALQAIIQIFDGAAYSNLLLGQIIQQATLNDKDRRLFTEIVYGTVSRKLTLSYLIKDRIENQSKLDDWVRYLLMLSVYQLKYLDRLPAHAVLNDAVEIAKNHGNQGIGKLVNGVLRTLLREGFPDIEKIAKPIERLSIQYSLPKALIKTLIAQYGEERATEIFASLLEKSKSSIRVNTAKTSVEEVIEDLNDVGIEVKKSLISPVGLVSDKGFLAGNNYFKFGYFTIQDESSQLVAPILAANPDDVILDACAAPGGKTTHIATYLNEGRITALDLYDHKLKLIVENAKRLGVMDKIETRQLDAAQVHQHFPPNYFDKILVDAPCSGLGLMRRKPDIRYNKRIDDFASLQQLQLSILNSCSQVLKKSGIMVYSTCTIVEMENQAVIEKFLATHQDFEMVELTHHSKIISNGQLVLTPELYQTDGFFICKLRRKA
ncbi:MAG: 16S rRNA (cytosine(967)-C(5))-methyltransferase RsmB [Streptococcaceae bacterium]|nr:16S rRNA (cytosine(967)-C(5))-methyltransferase RsmB [Streptococcaceae bacterium]